MPRSRFLTALLGFLTACASVAVAQELSPAERDELESLQQPESWFPEQTRSTRRIVDGQALDPRFQFLLARSSRRIVARENPLLAATRRTVR
ncbi:hypothetical protein [Sphingomonas sp. LaA6.9]|uniref:hypothetical protein n=1 Tax=Sphingomonas sp. LaA6.9 TaxID=2919914 RepID=UPI001F500CB4|nr:hypothetical protein [Sphingomonas sp. LaA6.9]MCJ8156646.1 hypothetical protein [Sphingomonas sp. LaA6.9]